MSREPEHFYAAVGQRIHLLRRRRKLTQEELGTQLTPPLTRASIANVEAGKQRFYAHTLVELARVLEVPIEDLLPGETAGRDRDEALERQLQEHLKTADVAEVLAPFVRRLP